MNFILVLLFIVLVSMSLSLKNGKKKTMGKHLSAASSKFSDKKDASFKKDKNEKDDDGPIDF